MPAPAAHMFAGPVGCMQMPMQMQPQMNGHAQWEASAYSIPPPALPVLPEPKRKGLSVHELLV